MRRTDQHEPASDSGPKRGRGRPSEGKAARMTFRFSPELHVWLAVQAAKRKTTRSRLIEEILETARHDQSPNEEIEHKEKQAINLRQLVIDWSTAFQAAYVAPKEIRKLEKRTKEMLEETLL